MSVMLQHVVIQYVAQLYDRLTDFSRKTEVDVTKGQTPCELGNVSLLSFPDFVKFLS